MLTLNGSLSARLVRFILRVLGLYDRGRANALRVRLHEVEVLLHDLPEAFDGYRVLHLSDLHFNGGGALPTRLTALLSGPRADMAVLTGDFVSRPWRHDPGVIETLSTVISALHCPDGMYAVPGNHDSHEVMRFLSACGVQVLEDRSVRIEREGQAIHVVGMRSAKRGLRPDYEGALAGVAAGGWTVLLVHKPDYARVAARRGVGLYLCGHTHGGQISIPPFGAPALGRTANRRHGVGLWRQGSLAGYTSPGAGTSFVPVRFGCPAEVALLTLRRLPGPAYGVSGARRNST